MYALFTLEAFMKQLAQQWGTEDEPAKYGTIAHRLKTTITTVGNLMHGIPSKRSTICAMADHGRLSRCAFLRAAGYLPQAEDEVWDLEHSSSLSELPLPPSETLPFLSIPAGTEPTKNDLRETLEVLTQCLHSNQRALKVLNRNFQQNAAVIQQLTQAISRLREQEGAESAQPSVSQGWAEEGAPSVS